MSAILENTGNVSKEKQLCLNSQVQFTKRPNKSACSKRRSTNSEQKEMCKKIKIENPDSKEDKRVACFSAGQELTAKFYAAEEKYAESNWMKGEIICNSRGKPSSHHSFTSEAAFECVYLHLVLSGYLSVADLKNLNSCNMLYEHLCKMINHIDLNLIYDLFKYDLNCAKQEEIPFKRSVQYLF